MRLETGLEIHEGFDGFLLGDYATFRNYHKGQTAAITPRSTVDTFWTELYECIYLFKLRKSEGARLLCDQLCPVYSEVIGDLAPSVFTKQFATFSKAILSFVNDLILKLA